MKQKYSAGQEKGQENKRISNPIDLFSAEVNGKDQITRIQDWLTQNLEVESRRYAHKTLGYLKSHFYHGKFP